MKIIAHKSEEGPFQVMVNIPKAYGGIGENQWTWMLCDAPLILYSLVKFGLKDDPQVKSAVEFLAGLIKEKGWPCAVSPDTGKFRRVRGRFLPCLA